MPHQTYQNIIVKMPNWVGDAVMATPVLADLRATYKDAKITALGLPHIAQLLTNDPNLSEVLSYQKPSGWIHRMEHQGVIEPLRLGHYDLGVLLTNSFTSAWWFWRGKVQERLGYATNGRKFLLNIAPPFPKNVETQHLVTTYKMLLSPLGIPLTDSTPTLYVTDAERQTAVELLQHYGISPSDVVVGINPGAAYGSAKCWLPERYREVTLRLIKQPNIKVLYFGDMQGASLVAQICQDLPEQVVDLAGKTTLRELMALIELCKVVLTNDSGPMHMASALGIPVVALFGSTSDVKTGPYKLGKVIHKHVECSPCYKRVCPIDFRCMTRIQEDEVYQALIKLIQESS